MKIPVTMGIALSAMVLRALADLVGLEPGGDGRARRLGAVAAMRQRLSEVMLSDSMIEGAAGGLPNDVNRVDVDIDLPGIQIVNADWDTLCTELLDVDRAVQARLQWMGSTAARARESIDVTTDFAMYVLNLKGETLPQGYVCVACGAVYRPQPGTVYQSQPVEPCDVCGAGASRIILWSDV